MLRQTIRGLRRSPGFTLTIWLTLALGIGANTVLFCIVRQVLLKPLPYPEADRLVAIWDSYPPQLSRVGASGLEAESWRGQQDLFRDFACYRYVPREMNLTGGSEPKRIRATHAESGLFRTLGLRTIAGRTLLPAEDAAPNSAAIISEKLWRSHFGGNPQVAGSVIQLNDASYTVAGVLAEPAFPSWADVWLAMGQSREEAQSAIWHSYGVIARLAPGVRLERVNSRLRDLSARLASEHAATSKGFSARATALQDDAVRDIRPALVLLFGAVATVLLIAVVNVANLLLARTAARQPERAMRIALGASRGSLFHHALGESLLLSAAGGALGWLLAVWLLAILAHSDAPIALHVAQARADSAAFVFTLAITLAAGLLAGFAPALAASREALRAGINGAARSTASYANAAVRSALIVTEFALALVLLLSATLLVASLNHLLHVKPGFQTQNLLTMRIPVSPAAYPDEARNRALFERLGEAVGRIPGVKSVAVSDALPLAAGRLEHAHRFSVPGSPGMPASGYPVGEFRTVSPEFFATLGIPLRAGRLLTARDGGPPYVVVINESLARSFWPGENSIGKRLITGLWESSPGWSTVIGVVGDVKQFGLDSEATYDLYYLGYMPELLLVRTALAPNAVADAVRRSIRSIDPNIPVTDIESMEEVLDRSTTSRRFLTMLLGGFAVTALVLAMIGIHGVLSFWVAQRTREIGIRVALGADAGRVLRLVLGRALRLAAAGLVIGLTASFATARLLAGLLFQVKPNDPLLTAGVSLATVGVAVLACSIPALRAVRVDTISALRCE